MQAIILAAGMGKRLAQYTRSNTKCMVSVCGIRLIDRVIAQLEQLPLRRLIVVVGYKADNLMRHIRENYRGGLRIEFVLNPIYDKTNNIYSLSLVKEQLQTDDTLLLESDLIFDNAILRSIVENPYPNLCLVEKYAPWMDGTMVRIDEDCNIVSFVSKKAFRYSDIDRYYKTINIYKFSSDFSRNTYVPFLNAYCQALGLNEYYEQVLHVVTLLDHSALRALPVEGLDWYEIDDAQDLEIAEVMFSSPADRLRRLRVHDGGMWRFPRITDFSHPMHPFFPTRKMMDEIRSNFGVQLLQQPSSQEVLSLLAAKLLGVPQELVAVSGEPERALALPRRDPRFEATDLGTTYGLEGLRLAVIKGENAESIKEIRAMLPSHPVDSFAEFFLQIVGKYTADIQRAREKMEMERLWMATQLRTCPCIGEVEAQASMLSCTLRDGISTREVCVRLLEKDHLLLGESPAPKEAEARLLLSVRSHEDNLRLLQALRER